MQEATVVVTGATSGIGWALARLLTRQGLRVVGLGRSAGQVATAEANIRREQPDARLEFVVADLGSQRQVREVAAAIRSRAPVVDALVNNAAEVPHWYLATEDGYERQFAVNHLAPFLLTRELAPALAAAEAGRVVTVSSGSHRSARIHWPDVMLRRRYHPLRAYGQSKLANVLFTYELNRRRAAGPRVVAIAADPGLVDTAIGSKGSRNLVRWIWERRRRKGVSVEEAAVGIMFLALAPAPGATRGIYYWRARRPVRPSRMAERPDEAARLWELSERLCGVGFGPETSSMRAQSPHRGSRKGPCPQGQDGLE
jgi:NAD(P)-dependent dehydrogenase (short-subunit alcohol dehydrogenase family)